MRGSFKIADFKASQCQLDGVAGVRLEIDNAGPNGIPSDI